VVGLDANAAVLYDGFRRAQKAKLSNALFVVASAESLPDELGGCADEVRIQFPWGSLLASILRADRAVLSGVARLLRPGGTLCVLLSVVERDRVDGMERLDDRRAREVARRMAAAGGDLVLGLCRQATAEDLAASHSTWAKRLRVSRSRPAWLVRYRKTG
jgi:SAM-dependent methyltransferase